MFKRSMAISLILLSATNYAKESKTSSTQVKVKKDKKVDKADQLITNRRMRADGGSLSSLSINSSFSYSGGSLDKPFSAERPNVGAAGDVQTLASMSGSVSGSYRLSKIDRLGLGAGLIMAAPFNQTIDTNDSATEAAFKRNQGKLDINDPFVSYSHITNVLGVQTVVGTSATQVTTRGLRQIGLDSNAGAFVNTMYNFGGSPFSVGAYLYYSKYFHNDNAEDNTQDTTVGFLPQAEWELNDKFNLRTIVRSNIYDSTLGKEMSFSQRLITQSVGLGISVTRDVFLYPNIQFVPQEIRTDVTNVGISANINMF